MLHRNVQKVNGSTEDGRWQMEKQLFVKENSCFPKMSKPSVNPAIASYSCLDSTVSMLILKG